VNEPVAIDRGPLHESGARVGSSRIWERWSTRLTSPAGVLLSVPLLTLAVGIALTALSYQRLVAVDQQAAIEQAAARTLRAELGTRRALSASDGLLDRMRELSLSRAKGGSIATLAFSLADLARQRAGLTWLSLSSPDGTFEGVFRHRDGTFGFQVSRVGTDGTRMTRFDLEGAALVEKAHAEFHYDPRERAFYRQALERKRRSWTEPYTFYPDFRTGITRTEAVFGSDGELVAVLTADFDVSELSGILSEASAKDSILVLFTHAGVVLGVSGLDKDSREKPDEKPLTFQDFGNPDLVAFFRTRGPLQGDGYREFVAPSGTLVAIERRLKAAPELDWRLALLVPKHSLLAPARAHAQKELRVGAVVVLLGVAVSSALALGVHRLRRARTLSEARTERVLGTLRELGSYTLEEPLGAGGMGQVFRARHKMLARPAAIKLIRTDLSNGDQGPLEQRFEAEAKVLSQLRSPHTVTILDYGRTIDGRLFIAMELLVGLGLDALIEKHGAQPPVRVIPILIGVCRSLAEAHAAGIVHRDIKPANLFLCHDADGAELVKVLDFGLAKSARGPGMSNEGHVAGTPHYMAPEQALGLPLDARADLYALGCVAFFLLTGKTLFDEPSDVAVILAHQLKASPALSARTEQWLPPELELLVQRCLAKDPAFRPPSASALARALAAIRIPEEQAVPADVWGKWWKRANRGASSEPDLDDHELG
jgi:hypothetical protein